MFYLLLIGEFAWGKACGLGMKVVEGFIGLGWVFYNFVDLLNLGLEIEYLFGLFFDDLVGF